MALKKITGKDFKEAVDWLWGHKAEGGCVHQVLGTTNDGTKLCFVVGWSKGADYGDDDKKYGYFDEGYCISAKIGYQHRNNAMQTDYDWDFNMPYDLETGDVWDTSSYVPRDADWEREAADYNKEAEKIWAAYGDPDGKKFWDDEKAPLDLMESKKQPEAKKHTCSMQKKKESLAKKNEMVRPEDPDELKVGKYTADVLTADGDFILSLPAFYDDVAETVKAAKDYLQEESDYVKDTGLVPSKIHVTTVVAKRGWNMPQFVKDVDLNATEAKKPTCSMQKKKESLAKKKSKKCEGLMDDLPYDAPVAIESLCAEIMSHSEEFTIEDADVAEMCGKWYIRDYANGSTAAHNEDEFVDEVLAGLSGSPVDGSPFGAAEAEGYARKIYNEVVA